MKKIHICLVGAGSSYTPEMIKGIIGSPEVELPVARISMFDVDPERMAVMHGLSQRMLGAADRTIEVTAHSRLKDALHDVDFVITQLRVGGMEARINDEKIPLEYGVIGQETTGPGGMFNALRTIPQMLDVARTVTDIVPNAFILNYANPSGIVTEAVTKYSSARIIGLCSGIPGIQEKLRTTLEAFYPDVSSYCVGLNHLGFVHRILSGADDITAEGIEKLLAICEKDSDNASMVIEDYARLIQAIPIGYVNYYVRRHHAIAEVKKAGQTRGEIVRQIEKELFREAASPALASYPELLKKRGGEGYSDVTIKCMKAIWHDRGDRIACSVPCNGAVNAIDDDAVVEVVCRIDAQGATPLPVGDIPLAFRGLIQAVKAYETLTVEAAVRRDKALACQALLNHPLVGDIDVALALVGRLTAAHALEFQ